MLFLLPSLATATLQVALTYDIPPYIMNEGNDGLEPAILRAALPDHSYNFTQMSYDEVRVAIAENGFDVALAVNLPLDEDGWDDDTYSFNNVFYSQPFLAFTNAAFDKTSDGIAKNITSIADLNNFGPVYTWEGAIDELGEEFEETFRNSTNYIEVGNQTQQILQFWETPNSIIVIDSSIFAYASGELGYSDYATIDLFPPVTTFAVRFADEELRDDFEQGMGQLCESGEYAELLQEFDMKYDASIICDNRMGIGVGDSDDVSSSARAMMLASLTLLAMATTVLQLIST